MAFEPDVVSGSLPSPQDFGRLLTRTDDRGELSELFRQEWPGVVPLRQWNYVRNRANVLRGMHVHLEHTDYLVVLEGEMLLALQDLRPEASSSGTAGIVRLRGEQLGWALVRPGILHGFYVPTGMALFCGLSHGWHMEDEFGCRWDDAELGFTWPTAVRDPILSERDRGAGSLRQLMRDYAAARRH